MKVFLTGGTGFIGQPLTRALLRRGWQVTALVRRPQAPEALVLAQAGASLLPGDVVTLDGPALCDAMRGSDMVVHNAGWYEFGVSGEARERMRRINVEGTDKVLGAAAEAGVRRIVYTSSTVALGDTGGALADESFTRRSPILSYYEQTKTDAHALALDYQARGVPVIIVAPSQVIGPGDLSPFGYFARLYVRGLMPPAVWGPRAVFTMGHVDDVAEAMALAAECGHPGETYFVGGKPIVMRDVIETWKRTPGGLKPFLWLPRPVAWLMAALSEPVLRLAGQRAFLSREVVNNSFVCYSFSTARAERELGAQFRPPEQAWLDTLAAERARLRRPA